MNKIFGILLSSLGFFFLLLAILGISSSLSPTTIIIFGSLALYSLYFGIRIYYDPANIENITSKENLNETKNSSIVSKQDVPLYIKEFRVNTKKNINQKKQSYSLSYIGGFQGKTKSKKYELCLSDNGLLFYNSKKDFDIDYIIEWENFIEILSQEANTSAFSQSLMTGTFSNTPRGAGNAAANGILGAVIGELGTKHPLIIRYRLNPNDKITHEAVFDTVENVKIRDEVNFFISEHFPNGINQQETVLEANTTENILQDIPDQIRKLSALMEDGLITQDEYDKKKSELLDRI